MVDRRGAPTYIEAKPASSRRYLCNSTCRQVGSSEIKSPVHRDPCDSILVGSTATRQVLPLAVHQNQQREKLAVLSTCTRRTDLS